MAFTFYNSSVALLVHMGKKVHGSSDSVLFILMEMKD